MKGIDQIGFDRPMTQPLAGSVKPYTRHLLVCTGRRMWPEKIEEDDGFLGALARAVAAQEKATPAGLKITACDEPSAEGGFDVILFPDAVRYSGLGEDDIPALLSELRGEPEQAPLTRTSVDGKYLLVCVHARRDPRCGYCGPILADLFAREAAALGLALTVRRTSHLGGHEYAGNVIVYPEGVWYGYVTPAAVPRILQEHVVEGKIVQEHWRGSMQSGTNGPQK